MPALLGQREVPENLWLQCPACKQMIFRTEPKATTLAIDFRIEGEDVEVGEFWIDDLSLEPLKAQSLDP